DSWDAQLRSLPADKSGPMGMLVYRISNNAQKRALQKRFKGWPLTEANQEAIAYGRLLDIEEMQSKLVNLSLRSEKLLKANTKKKIDLLEALQNKVTDIVNLRVGYVAVKSLRLLSE